MNNADREMLARLKFSDAVDALLKEDDGTEFVENYNSAILDAKIFLCQESYGGYSGVQEKTVRYLTSLSRSFATSANSSMKLGAITRISNKVRAYHEAINDISNIVL